MMDNIKWIPDEPRNGLLGAWDKFVGPGATRGEEWLQLIGSLVLAALLALLLYLRRDALGWNGLQIAASCLFLTP
jgi:hypothetical protein